jgi:hypothetical protein
MATVADYKDAVERIYNKHVDSDDLSKSDIIEAVKGANDNRIDDQTAQNIVDALPTTENVAAALNQRGGIPDRSDIENTAGAIDQYGIGDDRVGNLVSQMESAIVTQSDVERLTGDVQAEIDSGNVVTDGDISTKVNDLTSDKSVLGADKGDVVDAVDSDLGIDIPSQSEINDARKDVVEFDSGQSPRDVLGDEATELPNVGDATADQNFGAVRGEDGEIEAVVAQNESVGQAVSEELGAEFATPDEVNSGFEITQDRTGTKVTYEGETVREL